MAVIDSGSSASGKANVDSNYNLQVRTPSTLGQEGFVGLAGINDDGSIISGGRHNRVYVTEGNGLYAGLKNLLWDDTFNATSQNTAKYTYSNTTMTAAQSGGFLNLNSGSITTISTSCGVQTFRKFPLFAKAELRANFSAQVPNGTQANQTIEFGLFNGALNGAAPGAPTDGVLFRFNTTGELRGIVNYNGTETTTAAMTVPSTSANHDWVIVVQTNTALFYVDDILYGKVTLLTDAPTQGQPMMAASVPLTMRVYTAGSAPALAPILKVSDVFVSEMGPDLGRQWPHQKAGFGHMAYQGQNGGTMGSTSNYSNSAVAGAAALTNTAASAGTPAGLGGVGHVLPTLTAGTDGVLFNFQNPAGSVSQTPRNLIITGVRLQGLVDVVFAGGPLYLLYSIAFGSTAISLATTETGSFVSGTTKAPRRVMLGVDYFPATAAVGTMGQNIVVQFQSPIVVAPGEWVVITMRNHGGTVTTTGSLLYSCAFDAYYE